MTQIKNLTKLILLMFALLNFGTKAQQADRLYLSNQATGSIYDITGTPATLPSPVATPYYPTNNQERVANLGVGKDANNASQLVFIHSSTSNGSTVYKNGTSTGISLPVLIGGIGTNNVDGNVYGFSGKTLYRVYPSASNVGSVTGDVIWNSTTTTIFGSDIFFDAFGDVYIIVENQNGSTYTRYLYKVNIATLTATQVFQITGPVGNRNSNTNESTTSDVGNIRGVAYLDGYVYAASGSGTNGNIRIYRININDGTSEHVLQYTFSGSASNIDLASNATFAAGCEAGEAAPTVNASVSNTCPVATVNLNTAAHIGTIPTGAALVWFTNNTHTGSAYATPTAAVAGTYYAFYYDETNDCYSPASTAVTVTITDCGEICTEPVAGEDFSWNYPNGTPSPVTRTFTQPATNYGFVLDIYSLDNSFNLNINGTNIATNEIEFQSSGTPAPGINVRFADGDEYETDTEGDIWQMTGTAANPLIRVVINPDGTIALFGSKTSGGPLFPLELFNGNSLNTITWNNGGTNTIIATQNVVGVTSISGSGYGMNVVPCACYKPGLTDAGNTYPTKVGITALSRAGAENADNWPMVRQSGWIALEAKTKGFVPNRVAFDNVTGNPVGIATANFVEGMMVYDTTNKCLKIYTLKKGDTAMAWHCMTTQACPD